MKSRMISLEPSKIRLMRKSRTCARSGTASRRARAAILRSRSRGRRGSAACRRHAASRSPCSTASRSPPRAGCRIVRASAMPARARRRASIANVSAAMRPIFCAIASCLPIGWPHCTRSFGPASARSRAALADAGAARRQREAPRVQRDERELQPLALAPEQVLAGTFTFVKRITPFSMPLSPMKRQRWTTSTPGLAVSTMNAVICLAAPSRLRGVRAITTTARRACRSCTRASRR